MRIGIGRLIDHVHLSAHDLERSKAFCEATFAVLGIDAEETDDALPADRSCPGASAPETRGAPLSTSRSWRPTARRRRRDRRIGSRPTPGAEA